VKANPLGSLKDWVALHRPADAATGPVWTSRVPVSASAPDPHVRDPIGLLLPSPTTLRLVGIPVLILLLALFAVAGFAVGAARYFAGRRSR
jgi:hypothetical protein